MAKEFLLILLGLDIGVASPHLANITNFMLGRDWEAVMGEIHIAGLSFIIEGIIALIILVVLWLLHKGDKERKEAERNSSREENSANTQRIIDAIEKLGRRLSDKIDGIAKQK